MTLRIVCSFIAVVLLAGCNRDAGDVAIPPPAALNSAAMGVFCGMNVLEHPGPKGQIITASRIDPFWFTSVRDTVAFTLMPDQPRDIRAIYVSDMGRAPSWDEPGATNWVDARKAFFVIESRRRGEWGPPRPCRSAIALPPRPSSRRMAARSSHSPTFRAPMCWAATLPATRPNTPTCVPTDED